mmetsp:Transcript_94751/g.203554  ORF Transcript_94751/g.203554 Transcript_94751/m.203554 type:complete len:950 (+) Transcript_94751:148-2997(+)
MQKLSGGALPSALGATVQAQAPRLSAREALRQFYGHEEFRAGQEEAVQAVLDGKDALVVMATGAGKSICFQLPGLVLGRPVVVVSPLVSLMQDQVIKLNQTVAPALSKMGLLNHNSPAAAFLGSAQTDRTVEERVAQGLVPFVYLTPEKVVDFGGCELLRRAHAARGIALVAVDEAHCVSEWGHDFRPKYQKLGLVREALPAVPILGVTATATPAVRADIARSLRLHEDRATIVRPFGRPNLRFQVHPKRGQGLDLAFLVEELKGPSPPATVLYCISKAEVDGLRDFLQQHLTAAGLQVLSYHAGMSAQEREQSHVAFLTGMLGDKRTPIIVATVAFGMGIDKPDIRRVVHYGPPQTVEAYYQQAGRAGRDGAPAICTLFYSNKDFVDYKTSTFFAPKNPDGSVNQEQKALLDVSVDALQRFCTEPRRCRQQLIVEWLEGRALGQRPPPAGAAEIASADGDLLANGCGICDNCMRRGEAECDLTADALAILRVVEAAPERAEGAVLELLLGTNEAKVGYMLKGPAKEMLYGIWKKLPGMPKVVGMPRTREGAKSFLQVLRNDGYLQTRTMSFTTSGGWNAGFEAYTLGPKGVQLLEQHRTGGGERVMLPMPNMIREEKAKARERKQKTEEELVSMGVKPEDLPPEELEAGRGPAVEAYRTWAKQQKRLREMGTEQSLARANANVALMDRMMAWRQAEAVKSRMAPGAIAPEHLLLRIAYTVQGGGTGAPISELEVLCATAGLRYADLSGLTALVQVWRKEFQAQLVVEEAGQASEGTSAGDMLKLPAGWQPGPLAGASKVTATVTESLDAFCAGKDAATIAMQRAKPIQASTVENHLVTALQNAHPKAVQALPRFRQFFPNRGQVERLEQAVKALGLDLSDPKMPKGELVHQHFDGDASWYPKINWYQTLVRQGLPMDFEPSTAAPGKRGFVETAPAEGPEAKVARLGL